MWLQIDRWYWPSNKKDNELVKVWDKPILCDFEILDFIHEYFTYITSATSFQLSTLQTLSHSNS